MALRRMDNVGIVGINDPGTPNGNWTYRAPATIDELLTPVRAARAQTASGRGVHFGDDP